VFLALSPITAARSVALLRRAGDACMICGVVCVAAGLWVANWRTRARRARGSMIAGDNVFVAPCAIDNASCRTNAKRASSAMRAHSVVDAHLDFASLNVHMQVIDLGRMTGPLRLAFRRRARFRHFLQKSNEPALARSKRVRAITYVHREKRKLWIPEP
jgi:hypothetical protein